MSAKGRTAYVVITPAKVHVYSSWDRRAKALTRAARIYPSPDPLHVRHICPWVGYPDSWDVTICKVK